MPATFVFKPLQANLIYDKDKVGSMDPYCIITLGHHSAKTEIANSEGVHPHWEDVISLERKHDESYCHIKLVDHDTASMDDDIGEAKICLEAVEVKGRMLQWYSVYHQSRLAGELLLDIEYVPEVEIPIQSLIDAPTQVQTSVERHAIVHPAQPVVQHATTTHVEPVIHQQTYVQPQTYAQPVTQHSYTSTQPVFQQSYVQPQTHVQSATQHSYIQPAIQQSYVQPQTHVQSVTQHSYTQPVVQQSYLQSQNLVQSGTQHSYAQPVVHQSYMQSGVQSGVQQVQSQVAQSRVQQYI